MTTQEYANQLSKQWLGGTYQVTQTPGAAHASTRKYYKTHQGYDYATNVGTQVKSPIKGKVVYAGGDTSGWGNRVGVYDPTTNKTTYLSHLSEIGVQKGMDVNPGQVLARTGNTGNSTGAHLDITEYLGNKVFAPTRQAFNNIITGKRSYGEILKAAMNTAKSYGGRAIAVSNDINKLKALNKKGKIVKVSF